MSDNKTVDNGTLTDIPVATDEVTYSGNTADVQLTRAVHVAGAEGARTVEGLTQTIGSAIPAAALLLGGSDGTNIRAIKTDASGEAQVDVLTLPAIPAGTNNIGDVDVLTINGVAPAFGSGARGATVQRVTIATDDVVPASQSGSWSVTANAGTNLNTSALALESGGNLAGAATSLALIDDAIKTDDAGFTVATDEVMMAGLLAVAHGSAPDAADAADAVVALANRHRIPFHLGGHPNIITTRTQFTAAQTDVSLVGTINTGTKVVVTQLQVTLDNASTVFPLVRIGFGATNTPTGTGTLLAHGGLPAGGGVSRGDGSGILGVGADAEEVRITTVGAATGNGVEVIMSYFTIES